MLLTISLTVVTKFNETIAPRLACLGILDDVNVHNLAENPMELFLKSFFGCLVAQSTDENGPVLVRAKGIFVVMRSP